MIGARQDVNDSEGLMEQNGGERCVLERERGAGQKIPRYEGLLVAFTYNASSNQ